MFKKMPTQHAKTPHHTPHHTQPIAALQAREKCASCYQIGVCQEHTPACQGCDWRKRTRFAPGTVDGPFRRRLQDGLGTPAQRAELRRYLMIAAILGICVGPWISVALTLWGK
jgi:hypothetical protein